MDQEVLASRLGAEVRACRTERGWTLDEASDRLGVSRRLLVQVEQAEANPSLSTLLRIAAGFGVGLADLLPGSDRPAVVVVGADESTSLWSTPAGSEARLVAATRELELWEWTLASGDGRSSEAHRPGAQEVLTVRSGELVVEADGRPFVVPAGSSATLLADRPHGYRNDGDVPVRFAMAVHEPVRGHAG